MELAQRQTGERYRVTIDADDKAFECFLPDGQNNLTRLQIIEEPFLSIAQLSDSFPLGNEPIVFVGLGDLVLIRRAMTHGARVNDGRRRYPRADRARYPNAVSYSRRCPLDHRYSLPRKMETRLYEVLPYPRYPKNFQHRLW